MLQSSIGNAIDCQIPSENLRRCAFIMDEIDGMSGNEDRGGIQEIIKLINRKDNRKTVFICICNDRQSTKVRSLANHCLDIRFHIAELLIRLVTRCLSTNSLEYS
ncbi:hypothetical protein ACOME3_008920 [Neoechinorhynchus agilis]